MDLLSPKEIVLTDSEGKERHFIISKMDACDGLEIIIRWPVVLAMSSLPKLGGWEEMWEIILKMAKYIAIPMPSGKPMVLSTKTLISNHTGDWKCLMKLLEAEVEYNNGFFPLEMISSFFAGAFRNALVKISEISIPSSAPSSPTEEPASTNSAPSIP